LGYIEELRKLVGHRPVIFVGAVVVILDENGKVLLQQRKHPKGSWGIPGGLMELGESTEDVARREVYEETGLLVEDLTLINVYSGPEHFIKAENGDEFYVVTAAYFTKGFRGQLVVDPSESICFDFFHPKEFPAPMVKSHKRIIEDFLATIRI
jgi:8-oxo-dGTP pyrophosphatase MutT (NUDIX family)